MFMLALRLDAHVCPPRYSGAGSVCPDAGMNVMTMLCARLPPVDQYLLDVSCSLLAGCT